MGNDGVLRTTDDTLAPPSLAARSMPKQQTYFDLQRTLTALLSGERDFIANLANTAALLWQELPDINWAGFYLLKDNELVLGPFQGKPACVRIPMGKGVCGTAAQQRASIVVPNVHEFEGHIACDTASNSEIVIPLIKNGVLLGVLDIDSPMLERFDSADRAALESIVTILLTSSTV
jgi:GAF domain-containing protein